MKDLKPKTVKNRIRVLKAIPYKGNMIYIRMIGTDLFEWLLVFQNQIYAANIIMTPRKGQTKLSTTEIQSTVALVWAGATTTIDTLLGETVTGEEKQKAEAFLDVTDKINSKVN